MLKNIIVKNFSWKLHGTIPNVIPFLSPAGSSLKYISTCKKRLKGKKQRVFKSELPTYHAGDFFKIQFPFY